MNFRLNEGRLPLCRLQGLGQQREHPTREIIAIPTPSAAFSFASAFRRRLLKDIECWWSQSLVIIQQRRFRVRLGSSLWAPDFMFRHLRQIRADLHLSNVNALAAAIIKQASLSWVYVCKRASLAY